MARYMEIPRPERPRGTDAERFDQMYRYLCRLAEHLENIINDMSTKGEEENGGNR